jgi:hypothetical protein
LAGAALPAAGRPDILLMCPIPCNFPPVFRRIDLMFEPNVHNNDFDG